MPLNTVIHRYILREMVPPFIINLAFVTSVFLMAEMLKLTDLIVNYKADIRVVGLLMVYSMPPMLQYTIPMSVMLTVLVTFMRMSGDNEIIALKAGGVSVMHLLTPTLIVALVGMFINLCITLWAMPAAKVAFRYTTEKLAATSVDALIKPGVFIDQFPDIMLLVNAVDPKTRELFDVFIEDRRTKGEVASIMAPRGRLYADPEGGIRLQLSDGSMNRVALETRTVQTLTFSAYDVRFFNPEPVVGREVKTHRDEMTLREVMVHLKTVEPSSSHYRRALQDLHDKFSIPFACIALSFLALPLGLQSANSRTASGTGQGLFYFFIYYSGMSAAKSLGESGLIPVWISVWGPSLVVGIVGAWLLWRVTCERPIDMGGLFFGVIRFFRKRFCKPASGATE